MKSILLIICCFVIGCSDSDSGSEEPLNFTCLDGYPKEYENQGAIASKIDVYHYKTRDLILVRSEDYSVTDDRRITLISQTELSDSQHPTPIEYELTNGYIKDWRTYQKISINEDCTLITSNSIEIGVNTGIGENGRVWRSVFYDCVKTDAMLIEDVIDAHKQSGRFDSVYILMRHSELNLVN